MRFDPRRISPQNKARMWRDNIRMKIKNKSQTAFYRCPECQKYMWGDNEILQQHMIKYHVRDRANNKLKPFKFHPERSLT